MKCTPKKTKNMLFIIIIVIFSSLIVSNTTFGSTPPDPSDYTLNRIPAAFVDISETGYLLTLGDQQGISGIPLGFEINFYGGSYNTITITSNGYMTFSNLVSQMNTPFPSTQLPDNMIAPFWDDLNPSLSATGGVYFETKGTAPNRIFIVQWDNVSFVADPLSQLTFQAMLFESNNEIQFHYLEMIDGSGQGISGPASGSSASIGIESADGTRGTEVSFNQDGTVTGSTAFSFTLAGNAFEPGRLLGDLDNDNDITILDQSILTDLIIETKSPRLSTDLLLADTAPNYATEERAFGDGIINESDHDTIFQVMMGRQELNPVISGTSLFIAPPGESIILYGSGFDCEASHNNVIFTDSEGNSVHVQPDRLFGNCEELVVTVPGGLDFITSVQIERNTLLSNPIPFFLENSPIITAMNPDGGQPGDSIRIKGYEFGFAPEDNLVLFNGIPGIVTGVNTLNYPQELRVRVPLNVTTGPVTVTVGGNISNEVLFTHDGPPIVAIISPATGGEVTEPVEIIGTVFDYHLENYILDYSPVGESEYIILGTGTSSISNDVLGHFDPTMLLNGMYTIRLRATDSDGNTSTVTALYRVKGDMKIGNFTLSFVDLEVPVAGMPITITRTYDSRDKRKGDFGYGWSLGINSVKVETNGIIGLGWAETVHPGPISNFCIETTREHIVSITFPDGTLYEFKPVLSPSCQITQIDAVHVGYVPLPGTDAALTTNYDNLNPGYYNVLALYGNWDGVHLVDFNFNDYNPTLYYLTLPDGREFAVHINNGIQRITDLNGNVLTMSPNGITSMNASVPDSSKGVAFERDAESRITGIFDPAGNKMSYTYDAAGDLIGFTDREENITQYKYHPDFPHYLEEIIDPLGRSPVKNEYYDDGRLKSHTDANGNTITYNHDVEGRQEIVTDRLGNLTVYHYDEHGNVIREVQADGMVIDRRFDARNNMIYETESYDPANPPDPVPATLYEYDNRDNMLWNENALGYRTTYTYNDRDQVLTVVDPRGNWTIFAYDAKGNQISTINREDAEEGPILNNIEFEYDSRGNLRRRSEFLNGQLQSVAYEYDSYGNITKQIDAEGNGTTYTYNLNGKQLTQTVSRTLYDCSADGCIPSGIENLTTQYVYDTMGRLLKTYYSGDPPDIFTESVYDALGRQIERYDKFRQKTFYEYDRYEDSIRFEKITYTDESYEENGFDAENRRIYYRDRKGMITLYEYDQVGRLVKTVNTPVDGSGQPVITENHYNPAGHLDRVTDALGNITEYGYDAAGRQSLITQVNDDENLLSIFDYDENGNLIGFTDPRGNKTIYQYNAMNQRVKTQFPPPLTGDDPIITEMIFDEIGQCIAKIDQSGRVISFKYDKLGRLISVIQRLDGQDIITSYGYDELGNRISQTDALGRTTWYMFDNTGNEIARILPDGLTETKEYDISGKLIHSTDFKGQTSSYNYFPENGLLQSKTYPDGKSVSFTYSGTDYLLSATNEYGTVSYEYDHTDRIKNIIYPSGYRLAYDYNDNGNQIGLTAIIGDLSLTTTYDYNSLNQINTITDPLGRTYSFSYDENGNRTGLGYPNNTSTEYTYDNLNRLIKLETTGSEGLLYSGEYTLGQIGNRLRIIENNDTDREITKEYTYDDLYRLTNELVVNQEGLVYEKNFVYNTVHNRIQQKTVLGPAGMNLGGVLHPDTIQYSYDIRDRLILRGSQVFDWNENGNLISKADEILCNWDFENRLVSAETPEAKNQYVYDALGNKVQIISTIINENTEVTYLVDTTGDNSNVIAEIDSSGNCIAYYTRCNGELLSVIRPVADTYESRWYHADCTGSIRILTDETGTITDSYDYTAFGELIAHEGSDTQPYAFTGEPLDPDIGFQYHRARWLDPGVGRFLGMDPWSGNIFDPTSLHAYLYAHNAPSYRYDPSGQFTITMSGVCSMISTMATAGLVNAGLYAVFAGVKGEEISPEELAKAFAVGAITAPVGGLIGRAFVGLLPKFVEKICLLLGGIKPLTLIGKKTVMEKFLIRLSRRLFTTNKHHPPVTSSPVGYLLKKWLPSLEWQNHHVFIQQAWFGGKNTLFNSLQANIGLRRIGHSMMNLLPLPARINNFLGRNTLFSQIATQMLATFIYSAIVFPPFHIYDLYNDLLGDAE